jgi:hypothetical protein
MSTKSPSIWNKIPAEEMCTQETFLEKVLYFDPVKADILYTLLSKTSEEIKDKHLRNIEAITHILDKNSDRYDLYNVIHNSKLYFQKVVSLWTPQGTSSIINFFTENKESFSDSTYAEVFHKWISLAAENEMAVCMPYFFLNSEDLEELGVLPEDVAHFAKIPNMPDYLQSAIKNYWHIILKDSKIINELVPLYQEWSKSSYEFANKTFLDKVKKIEYIAFKEILAVITDHLYTINNLILYEKDIEVAKVMFLLAKESGEENAIPFALSRILSYVKIHKEDKDTRLLLENSNLIEGVLYKNLLKISNSQHVKNFINRHRVVVLTANSCSEILKNLDNFELPKSTKRIVSEFVKCILDYLEFSKEIDYSFNPIRGTTEVSTKYIKEQQKLESNMALEKTFYGILFSELNEVMKGDQDWINLQKVKNLPEMINIVCNELISIYSEDQKQLEESDISNLLVKLGIKNANFKNLSPVIILTIQEFLFKYSSKEVPDKEKNS